MPRQSIVDLRNAIESATEMTGGHREQMLALVRSLEAEVEDAAPAADSKHAENLRQAIDVAGEVVRKKSSPEDANRADEPHDLSERISDLEQRVEMVAVEHPVIANVLAAISRLT